MADKLMHQHTVRQLPKAGVENILIRGTNWIGDAIMTLAAVNALRDTYPWAKLYLLAKPWVADIYRLSPAIDEVITYERPGVHEGMRGMVRLAKGLKARRFDMAILLQNAIEAAIIARLAGIPIRAGYASDGRGFLLTHSIKKTMALKNVHQEDYYLAMVKALGCQEAKIDQLLKLADHDEADAQKLLCDYGLNDDLPIVGMAPGAAYGPAKRWFPERFAVLADKLRQEYGLRTILLGSSHDYEVVEMIKAKATCNPVDFSGKTSLRTTVSLIARCRLFVSNDSGLMHIAGALNIPTIALFGSTNPLTTAPLGTSNIIIYKGVACSPCLKTHCPDDFRCMELIEAHEVCDAAGRLLRHS